MIAEPQLEPTPPRLAVNRRGAGAGDNRRSARRAEGPLSTGSTPEVEMVQEGIQMVQEGITMVETP